MGTRVAVQGYPCVPSTKSYISVNTNSATRPVLLYEKTFRGFALSTTASVVSEGV